jgi:hypothetical protein
MQQHLKQKTPAVAVAWLQKLVARSLDNFTLVSMESLSELPVAQLFLWLQEKSVHERICVLFLVVFVVAAVF